MSLRRQLFRLVLSTFVLLMGCSDAPQDHLSWREAMNLVVLDQSGMFIEAQLSHGNTGLLRGQAHLAMTILPTRESSVAMYRTAAPQAVSFDAEAGSIRMVQNRLVEEGNSWTLHVREGREALDATLHLTARADEVAPVTLVPGQRQWILGAPVSHGEVNGAWRAGEQGGLVRGHGLLMRQSVDTWPGAEPSRSSVYLITPDRSVVVESVGDSAMAWIADLDGVRTGSTANIQRRGRELKLTLEPDLPVTATIRLGQRNVVRAPWDHLLPVERLLARLVAGWPLRAHERGRATLTVDGATHSCPALLVHGHAPKARERRRARTKTED